VTSMIDLGMTKRKGSKGHLSAPLNAQVLTTLMPDLDMLARVLQMSSSEFRYGNQYALVPMKVKGLVKMVTAT
jgi:hypothetical protein